MVIPNAFSLSPGSCTTCDASDSHGESSREGSFSSYKRAYEVDSPVLPVTTVGGGGVS